MTVSNNENRLLSRITQLKIDLAGKEAEANHLLEQYIAERRRQNIALRTIGSEVGLSHTHVRLIAKITEARTKAGQ